MALPKEWEFLCACASPASTAEEIHKLMIPGLNWQSLVDLAEIHGVPGVLVRRLGELGFAGVPSETRDKLQSRIRTQHMSTLGMTAELFRMLREFSQAGIDTVLVKGPVTSLLAYGDPAIRNYADLDLLVRQRDIRRATECMLRVGFEAEVPESAMHANKIPGEYIFQRPGTHCMVELHTENTFRYYPRQMRIEELFGRKRMLILDGRDVPALALEDELVLNCIHGAKHFWERLMWVSDVSAIVKRHPEINWEKARQAAQEVGAARMLRVGVQLGELLLRVKLPSTISEDIEKDPNSERLCRRILAWLPYAGAAPPPLPARAMFRLGMAGGGVTGLGYLMRLSLSPTQEDWAEGREEQRSWFWDAVRRPFRLFRKYGSPGE
ncbi:MAG: nucleotidyltransferase family protein [Candidatus Acidiferrum sp.]